MISHILIMICIMFVSLSALASEPAGKVIKASGVVTAEDAGCNPRDLTRGADIFKSDTIKTAADALATLRFSDGTVVDIASASSLNISEYHFKSNEPEKDTFKSELIQGGFRAITGTIGSRSPDQFTSKTRLTTLTVRGTGFAAGVVGDAKACGIPMPAKSVNDPVYISVIQGAVDVAANNKTFPLKADSNVQSFQMANGQIQVTRDVIDFQQVGIKFPTSMEVFRKEVAALPMESTKIPGQTTGAPTGGGGDTSPCGTLNAVGNALPASAKP